MSNQTSGFPIKLDTPTLSYASLNLPNNMPIDVRTLFWESPANAGDKLQLTNADGLVLFELTAEIGPNNPGNSLIVYPQPRSLILSSKQGWYPKRSDSGTLWIFGLYM
jgi:hypothetical protein